jgi:hypothetical protein
MPRKRVRADSAEAAVQALVNVAKGPIPCPAFVRLRDGDLPFWDAILLARARDEWTQTDLVVAAQLARCQLDIENESLLLDSEGAVVSKNNGDKVVNPRVAVVEQLAKREMALLRTLRMGGRIAGDQRDEGTRRKLERQARAMQDELAEDELLAH